MFKKLLFPLFLPFFIIYFSCPVPLPGSAHKNPADRLAAELLSELKKPEDIKSRGKFQNRLQEYFRLFPNHSQIPEIKEKSRDLRAPYSINDLARETAINYLRWEMEENRKKKKQLYKSYKRALKKYQELRVPEDTVIETIVIKKSPKIVFDLLGKSSNARYWSVFVHHITDLKVTENRIGSTRRCFCKKDETGITWDEVLVLEEKEKMRILSIFNQKGFLLNHPRIFTHQIYEDPLDGEVTVLSFTFFLKPENGKVLSFKEKTKLKLAGKRIAAIAAGNLENIKALAEQGRDAYKRVNPYKGAGFFSNLLSGLKVK
ncbi:hypothetical protein ACFL35_05665 [Candidatus Riflebacteria bacterium]